MCIGLGILMQQFGSHLCIAVYVRNVGKAFSLYLAGMDDPLQDGGTGFSPFLSGHFFESNRYDFNLDVYSIQ